MANLAIPRLEPMRRAIAALPEPIGRVYRLHLRGLDYCAIAAQLELDCGEAERRVADAIILIDRHLREQARGERR